MKQRLILVSAAMALVGLVPGDACRADLTDGLVAYYPFSGNANDEGTYGSDGVVHGAILATDRYGVADNAYYFDGANDYISASATHLPTGERTVAFWFNADTVNTRPTIIGYGGGGYGTSWLMGINHWGQPILDMTSHYNVNTITYAYASPPVGAWYYFAITTDSTGTKLYLNGELKASNATYVHNTIVTGKDLAIGVAVNTGGYTPYQDSNTGYMKGKVDEVAIWSRALSQGEVQALLETDLSVVPLPGAVLFGVLGLGAAGLRLRRFA